MALKLGKQTFCAVRLYLEVPQVNGRACQVSSHVCL